MKNKIALKLTSYFAIALIVFAFIISGIFVMLFRANTVELNKIELEQRAVKISETLSSFINGNTSNGQGQGGMPGMGGMGGMSGMGGYGAYIRFLNDIAMSDVWIVDEKLNIITKAQGLRSEYTFSKLPVDAEKIVKGVFEGKTSFSESFSTLLDTPTLTVGTPLKSGDGKIIGVVLLHSPINGVNLAISNGIMILVLSIGLSLIVVILLSIGFSITFTKPLNKMNHIALKLAEGDYTAKTDIIQNDEIGELASNMDILSSRLDFSSKQSEKLEQLRRDFVANISHELRTPITVIRGSLEALCDGVITEPSKVNEYHRQMLGESKGLQRLVGDLLDLSRLQNMDFNIEMSDVNLCEVVQDVIRSAKNIADLKDIELIVENSTHNCCIKGDYGRLRQMFMTILDNAIKFSPIKGHIYITLSQKDNLCISVRDEGIGIKKEDLPYIFERFYKTKSIENTNGTGLGLAIAKEIALRHHAEIKALINKDKGSEFTIRF
jgi:signal transduction histidine kinase